MSYYAVICTRSREEVKPITHQLVEYFASGGIKVLLMARSASIFTAYAKAFNHIKPKDDDIIIFCHDDIAIRDSIEVFKENLAKELEDPDTGFVGAAGTTYLSENAVWWNQHFWQQGKHRGCVYHKLDGIRESKTDYGPPGQVVALDGLFLAAKPKVIREVGLEKPEYFTGEWDFYDIHYTTTAHNKGFKNKTMSMNILHDSLGELVGRDSWHKNREAYIAHTELPLSL
jgi:hypothetical protein